MTTPSTAQHCLRIGELDVVIVRKQMRTVRIYFREDGKTLQVHCPLQKAEQDIRRLIEEKYPILLNRLKKINSAKIGEPPSYAHDSVIYFLGKPFRLLVETSDGGSPGVSIEKKDSQTLLLRKANEASLSACDKALSDFYKKEGLSVLVALAKKWQQRMAIRADLTISMVTVKSYFGICNSTQKRIRFNTWLMAYPLECIEMIVVHEFCHLREQNHSRRFYALMDKYLPNWEARDKRLNQLRIIPTNR